MKISPRAADAGRTPWDVSAAVAGPRVSGAVLHPPIALKPHDVFAVGYCSQPGGARRGSASGCRSTSGPPICGSCGSSGSDVPAPPMLSGPPRCPAAPVSTTWAPLRRGHLRHVEKDVAAALLLPALRLPRPVSSVIGNGVVRRWLAHPRSSNVSEWA